MKCSEIKSKPILIRYGEKAILMGERIRKMKETHTVDFIPTPAVFDDLPDKPTKSMEYDITKQPCNDPFDLAEKLGEVAREAVERAASKQGDKGTPSQTEGAQHTERSEV